MFQGDAPDMELFQVQTERDELKAALSGVEKRMEATQDTVKALNTERDHLKMLLKVSPFQNSRARLFPTVCNCSIQVFFVHSGSRGPEAEKHHGHVG